MVKKRGKKKKKTKLIKKFKGLFSRKRIKTQKKKRSERERRLGSIPGRIRSITRRERVLSDEEISRL